MPPMPTGAELATALRAADAADAETFPRYRSAGLQVETKDDASPVTEADRAAERAVRAVVAEDFPDDAIIGEEYGGDHTGGRRWIVDPIDATVNYVRGVPVWATLIAAEVDGVVTCGVVSAPALGRRWWAVRDEGVWCDGEPISVSTVTDLRHAQLSLNTVDGLDPPDLERALALTRRCARTRGFGDFWAFMLLAEGAVDVVVEPVAAVWDLAAVQVIVEEAGGRFTDRAGAATIAGGNAVATNGTLHDAVLALLRG